MSAPDIAGRVLLALGALFAGAGLAADRVAGPWVVGGRSMEPALRAGDRVLVDRWTYRHRPPRAGEVVLLVGPDALPLVKRVASVDPEAGGASAHGVWVVGDNAAASADSRRFGAFAGQDVRGRVVLRYWPPSRAGIVR